MKHFEKFVRIKEDMSNFDHVIPVGLDKKLKSGNFCCDYSAWNFCGTVFYNREKEMFQCEVMRYCVHVDTITSQTLQGIMEIASEKYGYD